MTVEINLKKECSKCSEWKFPSEFGKRKKRTEGDSGLTSHCKACEKARKKSYDTKAYSAEYYQKNKEKICKRSAIKTQEKYDYIRKIKATAPCTDCGAIFPDNPECLDFDHLEDDKKSFNISQAGWKTVAQIDEELKKGEWVCANCHRIRTGKRGQYKTSGAKGHKKRAG